MMIEKIAPHISVIVPTFNGALRISRCLEALKKQNGYNEFEIIIVNDGSTDETADIVQLNYPSVRLLSQKNAGPAAARNLGAHEAIGSIIMFTDDDCEPEEGWIKKMLEPFKDEEVVGSKGVYRTRQAEVIARFVQIEYEDKYRIMKRYPDIDFIDTYAAAFRRQKFLEMKGYDTDFPVACAEDVELSYRMACNGWKMKFASEAIVYHQHPVSLRGYLRKKFKFAYWRVLAVRKNPKKAIRDTHTPQLMKMQLLFGPAFVGGIAIDLWFKTVIPLSIIIIGLFLSTCVPFCGRAMKKDFVIGAISPGILAARSCAQFLGLACGIIGSMGRRPS